ncbi:MAG TPA: M14 family metallopeptidase, partial [Solirubrobacter sp.]|nr:M14 family metallopeptidase [Solirubrobacter sp.]
MVGKRSVTIVAAGALLFGSGGTALADEGVRGANTALVEVYVHDQADVDNVVANFDAAEYKRVERDAIVLNVDTDARERAQLRRMGFKIGRTIEDAKTRAAVAAERDQLAAVEDLAGDLAQNGPPRGSAKLEGRSVVPTPGETVIQRANTFTDVVGPTATRTQARFLYVEAHNKGVVQSGNNNAPGGPAGSGRTLAVSYKVGDGEYSEPETMGVFRDNDVNPDVYMYHRQLIRLPAELASVPAEQISVRVAAVATDGSTTSTDTFPVTEWLGNSLPPHADGYLQEFFTRYQDPTENRAQLDALAAQYPELVTAVNLPNLTNGYQRKSAAIMAGTSDIGSAPSAVYGDKVVDTSGEITEAQPVASIPYTAPAGQRVRAIVDAIPSGETDFILRVRSPTGQILQTVDTGFSPEQITRTLTTPGTYTFEILGFQGALGDFTFTIEPEVSSAAQAQSTAVVLAAHEYGQLGGNDITAEFKNPGAGDSPLSVAVAGKGITVNLATDNTGALTSTAADVVAAINATPEAAALVTATTYRGNAGAGIAPARAKVNLDDFLDAPGHVERGPFQMRVYRIGAHRDGSKVGVFLYCQQHAREWTTGLACVETAERLVKNYATDPETKTLLDNVEVFILPNVNPDGGHYSMYDNNAQRRNMTNHCTDTVFTDPAARNAWGVDLNRNNSEYTLFDGYFGASSSCTSDVYAGPSEVSEPEIKNEHWVVDNFPNIKFANNVHSYGGYFMWAPG